MKQMYQMALSLMIEDPAALWLAASRVAMASAGMTMDDVIDTIGSRDDPQIDDCIMMMIEPTRFAGCSVQSLDCHMVSVWPAPEPRAAAAANGTPGYLRAGLQTPA